MEDIDTITFVANDDLRLTYNHDPFKNNKSFADWLQIFESEIVEI